MIRLKRVGLEYPRIDVNPNAIEIELVDVRAANSITIMYDFERDGWVILSDLYNPDLKGVERPETLHEIGFINAWPANGITHY